VRDSPQGWSGKSRAVGKFCSDVDVFDAERGLRAISTKRAVAAIINRTSCEIALGDGDE
jgi:hypothetical protein